MAKLVMIHGMPGRAAPPPGALSQRVAAVLRGRKAELQVTDQQIGHAVGISQEQVSRYLKPSRVMSLEQTAAICNYLGLDLSAAMRGQRVLTEPEPGLHPEDAAIIASAPELTERQRKEARRALTGEDDGSRPSDVRGTSTSSLDSSSRHRSAR